MAGVLVAVAALGTSSAFGQTHFNVSSGNWTNSGSWNNGLPGSGVQTYIGHTTYVPVCTATVDNASTVESLGLILGYTTGDDGTLELAGDLTVNGIVSLGDFDTGKGTIRQTDGTFDANGYHVMLGYRAGAGTITEGTYHLSGGQLTGAFQLQVGNQGIGTFNLSGSGLVDGIGVGATYIGNTATSTGTVHQTGGTWNNNNEEVYIPVSTGSGAYNLSGDGVLTNVYILYVGHNSGGVGEFNLSDSAVASVEYTRIGWVGGSAGTVTQTGGTLNNNDTSLDLGYSGTGTYDLSGDGVLTNLLDLILGNVATGVGEFNLSGNGVLTDLRTLYVGNNGVGEFNMSGGTVAGITGDARLGNGSGSTGTVTQTGGTWDNNGKNLYVGVNGSGTYRISGGSLTNVNILIANGTLGDHTLIVEGSSASINVNHIHMNTASPTLRVKPDATALSPVNCSGQLYVNAATLEVDLSDYDGVGPLTLINYGTLNGSPFATVVTNTPGTGFEVDYDGGAITLTNITGCLPVGTVVTVK